MPRSNPRLTAVCEQDNGALAQKQLSDQAWAYFAGGAGDEITVRENRSARDTLRLLPRVMRPVGGGDTAITLLGRTWPTPLLLAPVALQKLAHPQREEATAMAAAAQGTGVVLRAMSSVRLETVAAQVRDEPSRGPLWFRIYLQPDRGATQALAAGAAGVIVSHRGGRTLDPAVATAAALPLLVDGRIRRGTDVLKALALGADAVLLSRLQAMAMALAAAATRATSALRCWSVDQDLVANAADEPGWAAWRAACAR